MLKKLNSQESYPMLQKAKLAHFQPHFVKQLVIFILLFFGFQFVQSIIPAFYMIPLLLEKIFPGLEEGVTIELDSLLDFEIFGVMGDKLLLVMLFSTVLPILFTIIYCRKIEKRSYSSMGFTKRKLAEHYLLGLFIGTILLTATVLICMMFGTIYFETASNISIGYVLLFFFGFVIQGMSEEVMCRGFLMVSLSNRISVIPAILTSSLTFAALHLFNPGINFWAILNIFLIGVVFSLYMLLTDNIWGVGAMHTAWNFVQGNIFGFNVSGGPLANRILTPINTDKFGLLNDEVFGLEGGLATTIVSIIAILIFTVLLVRRVKNIKS